LVGIEPTSMTAVFCHKANDRKAATWRQQLAPFQKLQFAISDAAGGIAAAVEQTARLRREIDPLAPALGHGLDLFHTTQEAQRVLAQAWRRVEPLWEQAESCDVQVERDKQQGIDARGSASAARAAWSKAVEAFEQVERLESAWGRCRGAFDLFGPDGRLNDRVWAEAEIKAGLSELTGPQWRKVRNFLADRRSLAFLDRMHQRFEAAEPRQQWREVLAWRWWRLHGGQASPAPSPLAAMAYAIAVHQPLDQAEQVSYGRIAAILEDTVRASSAVECMNSVLRMQQSRHRQMTQPMLDLKRLYWNCHLFRSGPRSKKCPYQALGLQLPTYDFWTVLQSDPADLTQQLSTQAIAA
jgi:hypothetical protein